MDGLFNHSSHRSRGFTLLEMLAVIVLLGIVATIVVRQVGNNVDKGKYGAGKAQLASLSMKVESYALDVGTPPKALTDLLSRPDSTRLNWNGPYAKPSDLLDPFGHLFGYLSPGRHGPFDLVFYGQDGQAGGDGLDADRGNWEGTPIGFGPLSRVLPCWNCSRCCSSWPSVR